MKRALAIINPISGTGSKRSVPELLGRAYQDTPFELFFTYTREAGHAEELARRAAAEGYDHVIAVGGDGTVNEVARGLLHSSTALGIIPKGSGNGLARTLGIPMNAEQLRAQRTSLLLHLRDGLRRCRQLELRRGGQAWADDLPADDGLGVP